jgi:hypothetical protein
MAKLGGKQAAVSMDRERGLKKKKMKKVAGWLGTTPIIWRTVCVLLTREGRPGELWRAI